jgi:hypothetical protein
MNPESPQNGAHHFIKSRTPAERNAERSQRDMARQAKREAATRRSNAQPLAGANVTVRGPQIESLGTGSKLRGVQNLALIYIDLDSGEGFETDFLTSGRRTPVAD